MAHHAHLVQRRLPIEHNVVAVDHVPLDNVAALQVQIARLGVKAQVDAVAVVAYDVLGARVVGGAATHQVVHVVDVEGRDELGKGHVLRNGARHTHLVDGQVGVGRDDGARAEVDTLSHEVAADAALFALEARSYGLERAAALLLGARHARHVVVDESGAVELEHLDVFVDDVGGGAAQLVVLQVVVHLDDVGQLVCEIVLGARRAEHDHRRSHAQRRHRHHGQDHPVGTREARIHAEDARLLVRYALEYLEHELGRHVHLLVLGRVVGLLPLGGELEALAAYLRLKATAAACHRAGGSGRRVRRVAGVLVVVAAHLARLAQVVDVGETLARLTMHLRRDLHDARIGLSFVCFCCCYIVETMCVASERASLPD